MYFSGQRMFRPNATYGRYSMFEHAPDTGNRANGSDHSKLLKEAKKE